MCVQNNWSSTLEEHFGENTCDKHKKGVAESIWEIIISLADRHGIGADIL